MRKVPLFIGATHGNEPIGCNVLKKLSKKRSDFDWTIGNLSAYEKNVRYVKQDLNRSAPGNLDSAIWEEKRAAQLIDLSKNYTSTIDIHGTDSNTGIFILVTNPTVQNIQLALRFDIKNIVIWPSVTPEMQYPPSEFFRCGIEIECGSQNKPSTADQLEGILENYLESFTPEIDDAQVTSSHLKGKSIYMLMGSVAKEELPTDKPLTEFEKITTKNEPWYPLFIDVYEDYQDIRCYKLRQLTIEEVENIR